jgi:hypothetical protein
MNKDLVTTRYTWNPKIAHQCTVAAEVAGPIIEEWIMQHGGNPPTELEFIELASRKSSALYPMFEWDNVAAGNVLRQIQARAILSGLQIATVVNEVVTETRQIRFIGKRAMPKPKTVRLVVQQTAARSVRQREVARAYAELRDWVSRYTNYSELTEAREIVLEAVEMDEYKKASLRKAALARRNKKRK